MENKGIQSLKASVMRDCAQGHDCFSENGCRHERYENVPQDNPAILAMGIKTKCISKTKCSHDYCGKYKWILERAEHYAEKTGKTRDEILTILETQRTYWYMNFYQECKQPLLTSDSIMMYDAWIAELENRFGKNPKQWAFKCPACENVQTVQMFIDNNIEQPENKVYYNCIGRYVKGIGCNWTLGGLLSIHKLSVFKDATVFPVFEMAEAPTA